MGFVSRLRGSRGNDAPGEDGNHDSAALADGALDTLGCVIRTMGQSPIPLDQDDTGQFEAICGAMARHIENGAAVPEFDIDQTTDGSRKWSRVRRFYVDRRDAESRFVRERLGDYRGVVEDLMNGLRQIGQRDAATEDTVRQYLEEIEHAILAGELPQIRNAMKAAIDNVERTFSEQKALYEAQINELNDRMSSLRQDLSAVREEMQRDTLTNAYNRGAFDKAVSQSLNLHFLTGQPVTLVLIDLDNFKTVNDTYGHTTGDEVLRAVGEALERAFIRKSQDQ